MITEIEPIIQEVLSASILTEAEDEEVSPNSGRYRYSSGAKVFAPGNPSFGLAVSTRGDKPASPVILQRRTDELGQ